MYENVKQIFPSSLTVVSHANVEMYTHIYSWLCYYEQVFNEFFGMFVHIDDTSKQIGRCWFCGFSIAGNVCLNMAFEGFQYVIEIRD